MTKLRAFGLAGALITGTVVATSAAFAQAPAMAPAATPAASYGFQVPPGSYMAPHYTGGGPITQTEPYNVNAGCTPAMDNTMASHYSNGGPYFTANCGGAFPVAAGAYMAPWYMPPGAAPVAAPPAVAPARSYLVFFDWDKATLTDRARQIIHEAADNSTHVQYTRIEVNGYTDTSGTPQYNMGLSIRRAAAVKAELVRDGVPATAITTQGFGETHLLVPTGPGVREPQNRRVEIIIR